MSMGDVFVKLKWDEYQQWYHQHPSRVNFFQPDSVYKVIGHDDKEHLTHVQEWTADRKEYLGIGAGVPDRFIIPLND
jgi:hypothetical protein